MFDPSAEAYPSSDDIRPMTEADVAAVLLIETAAYPFPWSDGIFRDCLRVGYQCQVYAPGGELRGYLVWSVAAGEAHVLNLCVAPAFQGRGIGRMLLRFLMQRAAAHGASELFLEVRPSNGTAVKLYESIGFNEIHRRRGYYPAAGGREDALVMACYLGGV